MSDQSPNHCDSRWDEIDKLLDDEDFCRFLETINDNNTSCKSFNERTSLFISCFYS